MPKFLVRPLDRSLVKVKLTLTKCQITNHTYICPILKPSNNN